MRSVILLFVLIVSSASVFSQTWTNPAHSKEEFMPLKQGWFAGVDVGTTIYYGDIALYNHFPKYKDLNVSTGTAYSLYGGKKFKWGLSAELQLFKGTLKGEKRADRLYPRYFNADITGYHVNAKYNLSQLLFRQEQERKFFNRITIYATVGFGQVFFRSRLYKYAVNEQWYLERTNSFETVKIDSVSSTSGGGLIVDKKKSSNALIMPIGAKVNFKLNNKTDFVFNFSYVTAFTDKLDSWERSWSHKDRYLYTGLGILFNFTQDAEDVPDSQRMLKPRSKRSSDASSSNSDGYDPAIGSSGSGSIDRKGLFKRGSKGSSKEDRDLEIRLKLYELQLKMFEMQYLIK